MKLKENRLFLFDFFIFIGLIIFMHLFVILNNLISLENNYFYFFGICTLILFFIYNFIKSIFGGILLIKSIIKNEITIKKKDIFLSSNIIFTILYIIILCFNRFRLSDPDINYTLNIFGLSFTTFQLYIIAIINIFMNMIGIPIWQIYLFINSNIKNNLKHFMNIFTMLIIFFYNWMLLIELTMD